MKKITYNKFGGTEVLEMVEAPMPEGEIIVKVKAVAINPLDWKIWQGEMKLMSGRKFPKSVGIDFSGVVAQGNGNYKKGDEVFGIANIFKGGALAEYVGVQAKDIAHKPASMTFEEAAALPVAGGSALQIFNQLVKVRPGMEVLINGAGGGIGPLAIQLAKKAGAVVTSVVGSGGIELVTKLGSDVVVNYKHQSIGDQQFDAVIDFAGTIGYKGAKRMMKKKGVYVSTAPAPVEMIRSLFSGGRYKLLVLKPDAGLLVDSGLQVYVGRTYEWGDFRRAYDEVKKGGIVGKAVFVIR